MKSIFISRLVLLTALLSIFSFILGFIYLSAKDVEKIEIPQEVLGSTNIELEEKEEESFTVSVCDNESCVWIPSDGLVIEGKIDENGVYQKILDYVLPYFEKKYGGKTFVKNRAGSFIYWKEDMIPDFSNIFVDILNAFQTKSNATVKIERRDLPGTDGKYAKRYIEIDNSKQKLYVWVDGKVQKEILLSAAKKGYEVYGVFPIIDKGLSPQAPSGSYMPYWMAFYYSPKQDSWYGLHSLIWWYDENGKKVHESTGNIGIRRSRGCIRMLLEDAKYIYEIYRKGDHILIHE